MGAVVTGTAGGEEVAVGGYPGQGVVGGEEDPWYTGRQVWNQQRTDRRHSRLERKKSS
jgi:hypothetical protein